MSTPELIAACDNNPLRAGVILHAVQEVVSFGRRPTPAEVDAICAKYQNFGEALQTEIDAAMDAINAAADAKAAALEAGPTPTEPTATDTSVTDESPPTVVLSRDGYLERLRQLNFTLASARAEVIRLTTLRNAARGRVADQLQAWVTGLPKIDRITAVKQSIAQHRIDKQTAAEQPHVPKRVGNSYFDRVGAYGRGDATTFLMKQNRRGGKRFTHGDVMFPDGRIGKPKLPSTR